MSERIRIDDCPDTVVVKVGGVKVAESANAKVLHEAGLGPRYYIPRADVEMSLLEPTDTSTRCPYKGAAVYWSVDADGRRFDDIVWSYESPIPEAADIAGLLCFYDNKDGVEQTVG